MDIRVSGAVGVESQWWDKRIGGGHAVLRLWVD